MLTVKAVFIASDYNGFRRRHENDPWHLSFELVPHYVGGPATRILVRNQYGEQYAYYDSLHAFSQHWQTVG